MPDIDGIPADIERERKLVGRRRRAIFTFPRDGRPLAEADFVLARQPARLHRPMGERDRLKAAEASPAARRRVLGGRSW